MKKTVGSIFITVCLSNAAMGQSVTNTEHAWVNKVYKLINSSKVVDGVSVSEKVKCAEKIAMGTVEEAGPYNYAKFIETVGGVKQPVVLFIAPVRSIDKTKSFAKDSVENGTCVSLKSTGYELMRFTSAAVDGSCVGVSSDVFVEYTKITKNDYGAASVIVERLNRMVKNETLSEVITTCEYGN
jgi:hypothetical protein